MACLIAASCLCLSSARCLSNSPCNTSKSSVKSMLHSATHPTAFCSLTSGILLIKPCFCIHCLLCLHSAVWYCFLCLPSAVWRQVYYWSNPFLHSLPPLSTFCCLTSSILLIKPRFCIHCLFCLPSAVWRQVYYWLNPVSAFTASSACILHSQVNTRLIKYQESHIHK